MDSKVSKLLFFTLHYPCVQICILPCYSVQKK